MLHNQDLLGQIENITAEAVHLNDQDDKNQSQTETLQFQIF